MSTYKDRIPLNIPQIINLYESSCHSSLHGKEDDYIKHIRLWKQNHKGEHN